MNKGPFQGFPGPMGNDFIRFMNQMKGKNPNEMISQAVQRLGLSQEQLNSVQNQAAQMMGQFNQFRNMFGFR